VSAAYQIDTVARRDYYLLTITEAVVTV